ncbi:MAG TPA: flagellar export chaperone FliS [Tepidisphaeraceae bacterium]|jgi:flagellar protein FliS|nr:flagellar export chaperone FliS [Tepidisphaeraceae bacterium]
MNPQAAQNYLRTKVLTATPEQLQLLLFDGAIRFGHQAREALKERNWEQSYTLISRVQKIVTELNSSLKHGVYPELCGKLASLYNYAYRNLIDASVSHKIESLDEALRVLAYQRDTWAQLLQKMAQSKAGLVATKLDMPSPDARMEASISMQG